jgi:hypothetical protein
MPELMKYAASIIVAVGVAIAAAIHGKKDD